MHAVPARDTFLRIVGDGGLATRVQIFSSSAFFLMPNQEMPTAAEMRFLKFCRDNGAETMYNSLSTTLSLSITKFIPDAIGDENPGPPGVVTLEAWFFTLEMLKALHRLDAAEKSI